jgi:hypothetical protein
MLYEGKPNCEKASSFFEIKRLRNFSHLKKKIEKRDASGLEPPTPAVYLYRYARYLNSHDGEKDITTQRMDDLGRFH